MPNNRIRAAVKDALLKFTNPNGVNIDSQFGKRLTAIHNGIKEEKSMSDNEPCIMSVADMMRESLIRLRTDMVFERPTEARDFVMEMFANGRLGYNDMSDDEIAMEYDDWFEGRSNPYFPELDELAKEDADD